MDETPKLQRKSSLSLSSRFKQKRHSASPQNRLKTANSGINANELNSNSDAQQRSPSVISICSDVGIECTPPHKKVLNFNESLEFSPKIFDSSFSPTCLMSQTLAIDSPEVGWKWSRHTGNYIGDDPRCGIEKNSIHTPDSAYAADSSFASAGSSSTEVTGQHRTRGYSYQQRITNDARRDQRKLLERELRRVEKTRAEEMLKQRCAKLRQQLKSAGSQNCKTNNELSIESPKKNFKPLLNSRPSHDVEMKTELTTTLGDGKGNFSPPVKLKTPELLNDFFNDSDSDGFLLEATQDIELKIETKTQPALINFESSRPKSFILSKRNKIPPAISAPAATSKSLTVKTFAHRENVISSSENKDKRSSFYMKFLEDDCSDDWFASLDEVISQATQNKKPRNSLQRYKSMPAEAATKSKSSEAFNKNGNNNCCAQTSESNLPKHMTLPEVKTASLLTHSKMKRHSSTHILSPANSNCRSRKQL